MGNRGSRTGGGGGAGSIGGGQTELTVFDYKPDLALLDRYNAEKPGMKTQVRGCDYCRKPILSGDEWVYCWVCDIGTSYDVCDPCYRRHGHCHPVRRIVKGSRDEGDGAFQPTHNTLSLQLAHKFMIHKHRNFLALPRPLPSHGDARHHSAVVALDTLLETVRSRRKVATTFTRRQQPRTADLLCVRRDRVPTKKELEKAFLSAGHPDDATRDAKQRHHRRWEHASQYPLRYWNEAQRLHWEFVSYHEIFWRARWFATGLSHLFASVFSDCSAQTEGTATAGAAGVNAIEQPDESINGHGGGGRGGATKAGDAADGQNCVKYSAVIMGCGLCRCCAIVLSGLLNTYMYVPD